MKYLVLRTDEEIQRSFTDVDTDNSGVIERPEFLKAIKGSRMAELSLSVLMTQIGGKLDRLATNTRPKVKKLINKL